MATINVRIDDMTKADAESILKELGISASAAITMFYRQIIHDKALPFQPSLRKEMDYRFLNTETKMAIAEGKKIAYSADTKGYHNVKEMFKDILNDEDKI